MQAAPWVQAEEFIVGQPDDRHASALTSARSVTWSASLTGQLDGRRRAARDAEGGQDGNRLLIDPVFVLDGDPVRCAALGSIPYKLNC